MIKSSFLKDMFREIWYTKSRFISIFTIIAIGVGFFAGLNATCPNNKYTADAYFTSGRLFDVRLLSTIGFDESDVETIRSLSGVDDVMPVHTSDLLVSSGSSASVIRVHGMPLGLSENDSGYLNRPSLLSGRLPEKSGECVIDSSAEDLYPIGSTVTLTAGSGDDLSDTLSTSTYTVTGIVRSPGYISRDRGSTTVGNGTVNCFMMIPDSDFVMEIYTDLYIASSDTVGVSNFDSRYDELVEALQDRLKLVGDERVQIRYDDIMGEANDKLADARRELADGIDEQTEQLADARVKIDDAKRELANGERELADSELEFADEIAKAEQGLEEARQKLADGQTEYEEGAAEFHTKSAKAREEFLKAEQQIEQLWANREPLLQAAQGYQLLLDAEQAVSANDADSMSSLAQALGQVPALGTLGDLLGQISGLAASGSPVPPAMTQGFLSGAAQAREALNKQTGGQFDLSVLDDDTLRQQINNAQEAIDDGKEALEEARQTLLDAEKELAQGKQDLADGEQEFEEGKTEGQQKIAKAKVGIEDAYRQIAEAEQDYAEGERDSNQEIADAKVKISDAERDLADFAFPEWFIQDRDDLPGHSAYAEDADRIAAIARVFPVFFLLVAALVCLTTMTRMIEEQRTQIGTLKALGYGSFTIVSKYLVYALSASLTGSAAGLAVGFQLFPRIIYNAYGIMYVMPPLITRFHWDYALIATLAAVLTTVLSVVFASYKELGSVPAALMRPKAPKLGKRVLLERLPLIWNRLNFTQKVTMRNLLRYKKRMLMTVVGIAGCTALMLTGFGVKDSISTIVSKQFSDIFQYDMLAVFDKDIPSAKKTAMSEQITSSGYSDSNIIILQESYDVLFDNKRVSATLFVPQEPERSADFIVLRDRLSRRTIELGNNGVILTEKTARLLGAEAGDTIDLRNSIGRIVPVSVADVTENYAGHYVYMTPALYSELLGTPPDYNALLASMLDPENEQTRNAFSELLLESDSILVTSFNSVTRDHFNDVMQSLNYVVLVLILSAGALAFVVLYNLTNININERIREIATIKVLGFFDKEVSAYIYRENIILTLLGMLAGLAGGVALHRFVILTAEVDMVMFGRQVEPLSFVYAGALTLLFAFIVNGVMYRKLQQVSMVESLKSVE